MNRNNHFDVNYGRNEGLVGLYLQSGATDLWREQVGEEVTSFGIGVCFLFGRETTKLREVIFSLCRSKMRAVLSPG